MYYLTSTASEKYMEEAGCQSRPERGSKTRHQKQLHLFPAVRGLEFQSLPILGSLAKKEYGSTHVIVFSNRYKKGDEGPTGHNSTLNGTATVLADN